jgi:hypothetical protein
MGKPFRRKIGDRTFQVTDPLSCAPVGRAASESEAENILRDRIGDRERYLEGVQLTFDSSFANSDGAAWTGYGRPELYGLTWNDF